MLLLHGELVLSDLHIEDTQLLYDYIRIQENYRLRKHIKGYIDTTTHMASSDNTNNNDNSTSTTINNSINNNTNNTEPSQSQKYAYDLKVSYIDDRFILSVSNIR